MIYHPTQYSRLQRDVRARLLDGHPASWRSNIKVRTVCVIKYVSKHACCRLHLVPHVSSMASNAIIPAWGFKLV